MLVTHQLQFLTDVPKILVLKDNKQAVFGDFETLTKAGFDIMEILQSQNKALKENGKLTKESRKILKKLSKKPED